MIGDVYRYGGGTKGVVVCSIDAGQFSVAYSKKQWGDLKRGILA